ncbi:unnamed protein product, partial [Anisakis simplex]|uniref:Neur_chan_LBD domain-containing protein n=1 Tax=Anisakis simplex TaxID=6269 RepID=A0A0M3JW86_ANISI
NWNDYKLRWDPKEYSKIQDIRIPGTAIAIWKPDVLLYNSADENFDSTYPVNYIIGYNGDVMQVPLGIMKLSCKIDITWFPFDDQMCHQKVVFASMQPSNQSSLIYSCNYNVPLFIAATPAHVERTEFGSEPYCAIFFLYHSTTNILLWSQLNHTLFVDLTYDVLGFTLTPDAGEKITLDYRKSKVTSKPMQQLMEWDGEGVAVRGTPISVNTKDHMSSSLRTTGIGDGSITGQSCCNRHLNGGICFILHKGIQKVYLQLGDIAEHMKAMRKRMEEDERVSVYDLIVTSFYYA